MFALLLYQCNYVLFFFRHTQIAALNINANVEWKIKLGLTFCVVRKLAREILNGVVANKKFVFSLTVIAEGHAGPMRRCGTPEDKDFTGQQ